MTRTEPLLKDQFLAAECAYQLAAKTVERTQLLSARGLSALKPSVGCLIKCVSVVVTPVRRSLRCDTIEIPLQVSTY